MEFIRQLLSGRVAKAIIFVLLLSFAFWGVDTGFFNTRGGLAAQVGEREISLASLDNNFQRARTEANRSGSNELRREVLENMVLTALQEEFARKRRLRVSDSLVTKTIRTGFQNTEGAFDRELYETYRNRNSSIEDELRYELSLDLLRSAVLNTAFTLQPEVEQTLRLQRQLRDLDYAVLSPDKQREELQPEEGELEQHYDKHKARYRIPERARVHYLELDPAIVPARVTVEEEPLRNFYELRRENYSYEEERKSTQVLVRIPNDAAEALREQALQQAERLLEAARSGDQDLAELVQAEPEAETDGPSVELNELGLRPGKQLPEVLAKALFDLDEVEAFSEVLEDTRGFLFLRLDEIKAGRDSTFENSRDDAEADYRKEQADSLLNEMRENLDDLTYQSPDSLQVAADVLELPLQESGWFSREGPLPQATPENPANEQSQAQEENGNKENGNTPDPPGISPDEDPKFRSATFAPAVLREGRNSPLLEMGDGRILVLRILEHEEAVPRPLAEVREELQEHWARERAAEETRALGERLLRQLREGADPEHLAEEEAFQWQRQEGLQRNNPEVPQAVLRRAFALPHPQEAERIYDGFQRGDDSYALLALHRVAPEEEIELSKEDLRQATPLLENLNAVHDNNEWLNALKAETKIKYYESPVDSASQPAP